jgi:hypothetical protein
MFSPSVPVKAPCNLMEFTHYLHKKGDSLGAHFLLQLKMLIL